LVDQVKGLVKDMSLVRAGMGHCLQAACILGAQQCATHQCSKQHMAVGLLVGVLRLACVQEAAAAVGDKRKAAAAAAATPPAKKPAQQQQQPKTPATAPAKSQQQQKAATPATAPSKQQQQPKTPATAPAKQQQQQQQQQKPSTPLDAAAAAGVAAPVPTGKKGVTKFENGFEIHNLSMGKPDGKLAKPGKQVEVRYVGKLTNGKVFDQSKGKSTFKFRLGKTRGVAGCVRVCLGAGRLDAVAQAGDAASGPALVTPLPAATSCSILTKLLSGTLSTCLAA
jgi:FKBP-type peptidyl-prolyl cis-trans isomerase